MYFHKMEQTITFGKYKGKTYEFVLNNDIGYCEYVMSQSSCSSAFKSFKLFLERNLKEKLCETYNPEKLKNIQSINCTRLIKYMEYDKNVSSIINQLNSIEESSYSILSRTYLGFDFDNFGLAPNILGQFVDYLIRYEISKRTNQVFEDSRTEYVLGTKMISSSNELYDELDNNDEACCFITSNGEVDPSYYNNSITIIKTSYSNMQNKTACLVDILNTSIAHSLFFCGFESLKYVNAKEHPDKFISSSDPFYVSIINWIETRLKNNYQTILLNPALGNELIGISADADLIFDEELIDIKTSRYLKGDNKFDFVQLLVYASLFKYNKRGSIKKITIFNPLYNTEQFIFIDDDVLNKMIDVLLSYEIAKKK